ncbi:MAG TPA: DUF3784 domain-containing protein [Lachnospiraceae bacterium]|nr:DUF3784 domain-containing protein [Lachnospiraceae bacterium]
METGVIITAVIIFSLAAGTLVFSIFQFLEKGFLFNNAYLYASKEERGKMDKKPHYRQSAIVFLMICFVFIMMGLNLITGKLLFLTLEICLIVTVLIYAIVSSIMIEKAKKRSNKL